MAIARPTRPWREATQDGSGKPTASRVYKIWAAFRAGAVEGNVDDRILLAADESAPAGFEKDGPGVDAVLQCCGFSVAQKTRVNAGEDEGESLSVDADRSVLQAPLGDVSVDMCNG